MFCLECGAPLVARGRTRVRLAAVRCVRCEAARAELAKIARTPAEWERELALATAEERWQAFQRSREALRARG